MAQLRKERLDFSLRESEVAIDCVVAECAFKQRAPFDPAVYLLDVVEPAQGAALLEDAREVDQAGL